MDLAFQASASKCTTRLLASLMNVIIYLFLGTEISKQRVAARERERELAMELSAYFGMLGDGNGLKQPYNLI